MGSKPRKKPVTPDTPDISAFDVVDAGGTKITVKLEPTRVPITAMKITHVNYRRLGKSHKQRAEPGAIKEYRITVLYKDAT